MLHLFIVYSILYISYIPTQGLFQVLCNNIQGNSPSNRYASPFMRHFFCYPLIMHLLKKYFFGSCNYIYLKTMFYANTQIINTIQKMSCGLYNFFSIEEYLFLLYIVKRKSHPQVCTMYCHRLTRVRHIKFLFPSFNSTLLVLLQSEFTYF